jgi:hypothetical protein
MFLFTIVMMYSVRNLISYHLLSKIQKHKRSKIINFQDILYELKSRPLTLE